MPTVDDKRKIFSQLAALNTLNSGMPSFKKGASLPSINVSVNGLDFLIDLLKSLIGLDEMRESVVDILSNLDDIEQEVKQALKLELKGLVNCGVDPSIPAFLKNTGTGADIPLKTMDFLDIMFVDPSSIAGGLIYSDVSSGFNSSDFNTFLFNTIQDATNPHDWSTNSSVTANPIFTYQFNPSGTINNTVNIKASSYYSNPSNNKTLTDLNNDYIDSIKLFPSDKVLTNLMDSILGTVSSVIGKSRSQLEIEEKINMIIDKISATEKTDVVDNSYFSFSNEELSIQQINAENRGNGVTKFVSCGEIETTLTIDTINTGIQDILSTSSGTLNEQKTVINRTINTFGDSLGSGLNNEDKFSAKLNFIESLLRKIIQVLVGGILSPKVVSIFILNYLIINNGNAQFSDVIDFMQKNKTLFKNLIRSVRDKVISMLMQRAIKAITELALANLAGTLAEKATAQKTQILSLLGVPQDVIRKVNKLGRGLVTVSVT